MGNSRKRKHEEEKSDSTTDIIGSLGIGQMPGDMLFQILNYLSIKDLKNVSLVCYSMSFAVQLTNEYLLHVPQQKLRQAITHPVVAITVLKDENLLLRFPENNSFDFFSVTTIHNPVVRYVESNLLDQLQRLHINNEDVRDLVSSARGKSYALKTPREQKNNKEQTEMHQLQARRFAN